MCWTLFRFFCQVTVISAPALAAAGCAVERIQTSGNDLNAPAISQLDSLRHVSVAVDPHSGESTISFGFVKALQDANVFRSVEYVYDARAASYLVISHYRHNTGYSGDGFQCQEPLAAVLTLGLVPVVCEEPHSLAFSMSNSDGQSIQIEADFVRTTVVGWAALTLRSSGWFPRNNSNDWEISPAYERYLRDLFLSRANQIIALAGA